MGITVLFDKTLAYLLSMSQCSISSNRYRWTKDGQDFAQFQEFRVEAEENSGSFVLQNKHLGQFQGKYRCYASNKLGTAISKEVELIVTSE